MSTMLTCPRCANILIGPARTCLIHGDQIDVGGRAPAVESLSDQRRSAKARRATSSTEL
jgi:hypothetical protein